MTTESVERWVLNVLRSASLNVEEIGPRSYRAVLGGHLKAFFPGTHTLLFTFDHEYFDVHRDQNIEFVAAGYPLLDRLIRYVRTHHKVAEFALTGSPLAQLHFASRGLRISAGSAEARKFLIGFHYKASFRSEVQVSEEIQDVWVDPSSGVIVDGPAAGTHRTPVQTATKIDEAVLKRAWGLAHPQIDARVQEATSRFETNANVQLVSELDRLAQANLASAAERDRLKDRHRLQAQWALAFAEIAHYPMQRWAVRFEGRGWQSRREFTWDAVAGRWENPPHCNECGNHADAFEGCDEGRHETCDACHTNCRGCHKGMCSAHPPKPCSSCAQGNCRDCLDACRTCRNDLCRSCRTSCPECGDTTCRTCLRGCAVCADVGCQKHFVTCHLTQATLCHRHVVVCDGCARPTHPEHVVATGNRVGRYCRDCVAPCSEPHATPVHLFIRGGAAIACQNPKHETPHVLCAYHRHACRECRDVLCPGCVHKCTVCGDEACDRHALACHITLATFCSSHARRCAGCQKVTHPAHLHEVIDPSLPGGGAYCDRCVDVCGEAHGEPRYVWRGARVGITCDGSSHKGPKTLCADHRLHCATCHATSCSGCASRCSVCGDASCEAHALVCHVSGASLCQRHGRRCAGCDLPTHPDHLFAIDDPNAPYSTARYCSACVRPCCGEHAQPTYVWRFAPQPMACRGAHAEPHHLCSEHRRACTLHGSPDVFCDEHVATCAACANLTCAEHHRRSQLSGRIYCDRHHRICSECQRSYGVDEAAEIAGRDPVCRECALPCSACPPSVLPEPISHLDACRTCRRDAGIDPTAPTGSVLRGHPHLALCKDHVSRCHICEGASCARHDERCAHCERPTCAEHMRVSHAGERLCERCTARCVDCPADRFHAIDGVVACRTCGDPSCGEHLTQCETCENPICSKHVKTCRVCGSRVCPTCHDQRGCISCRSVASATSDALGSLPLPSIPLAATVVMNRRVRSPGTNRVVVIYHPDRDTWGDAVRALTRREPVTVAVFDEIGGKARLIRTKEVEAFVARVPELSLVAYLKSRAMRGRK